MYRQYSIPWTIQLFHQPATLNVIDAHFLVQAASDELRGVELQTSNALCCALECLEQLAGLDVVHRHAAVIRAGSNNMLAQDVCAFLQTRDAVLVVLDDVQVVSPVLPIVADLEAVSVDILPWPFPPLATFLLFSLRRRALSLLLLV